jgi:hypothetical protein
MSQPISWRPLPGGSGRGRDVAEDGTVTWMCLTAGAPRNAVGVTRADLSFESTNPTAVVAEYDAHHGFAGHDLFAVKLTGHHKGEATIHAKRHGNVVASLKVNVYPLRKVRLSVRNIVSQATRDVTGTQANQAAGMVAPLDQIFIAQGGFTFQITRDSDYQLTGSNTFAPLGASGPQMLDATGPGAQNLRDLLKDGINTSADFTVFFCKGLYGAPCAVGLSLGRIIVADELMADSAHGKERSAYWAHVLAHEIVHSMGHTHERYGRDHAGRPRNLMYPTTQGKTWLSPRQIAYIANSHHWYRS